MSTHNGILKTGICLAAIISLLSCQPGQKQANNHTRQQTQSNQRGGESRIELPGAQQPYTIGDLIPVELIITDTTFRVDSVEFYMAGRKMAVLTHEPYSVELNSINELTGKLDIRTNTCYSNNSREVRHVSVVLLSDIEAVNLPWRLVETFPHDVKAYTQGLIYHEGYLFEGTGQYNESSLRRVELETGRPERILNLPGDIFGEGITIFDNKIYQLTYKSQVGFVYDLNSFNQLQKVYYQNKEGWGLTHDGENLIMSDGTHMIYFMDPEYFTEVHRIEVYDNNGPVTELNELEYIRGRIFANIYGSEEIVIIDPSTGKLTGRLNMKGILPPEDRKARTNVFNGIAWDPGRGSLFVTGKYWPKLFEIKIEAEF